MGGKAGRLERHYTVTQKAEAVARVIAGESMREAAQDLGVPYETLRGWVAKHRSATARLRPAGDASGQASAITQTHIEGLRGQKDATRGAGSNRDGFAAMWASTEARAAKLISRQLDDYERDGRELSPRELQHIAIVGGISSDKHLDHRDGRKGATTNVDARQVHVALSPEQAAALIAEAQRHAGGADGLIAAP